MGRMKTKPVLVAPQKQPEKMDAQKFFDAVMRSVKLLLADDLLVIKRDIEDLKFQMKQLRKKQVGYELDYKALGFAIAELGVVELNVLNLGKNMMRDKLSVILNNGQIRGRVDVTRYNLVPEGDYALIENMPGSQQ